LPIRHNRRSHRNMLLMDRDEFSNEAFPVSGSRRFGFWFSGGRPLLSFGDVCSWGSNGTSLFGAGMNK
jgi:hypothetical protein